MIEINKLTHTLTIKENELINNNSVFLFKNNILYIIEKEPFIEYSIDDIETLEYSGKVKHKVNIICQKF